VYDAPSGGTRRDHRAVRLRSYEGGRRFARVFPAGRVFQVGEYVGWDWDLSRTSSESWVEGSASSREYAWTGSGYFVGRHLAHAGRPSLVEIQLRPHDVRLRVGERAPLRVIAFYRDGPACWREDVTERSAVESLDPGVLLVTAEPALHAKRAGSTQLRARYEGLFSTARVVVAALQQGTVVEWLGGYRRMVALLSHPDAMLVAHQADHLLAVPPSMRVERLAHLEQPDTSSSGIDVIAASPQGDLYLRTIWNREVVQLPRAGGFTSSVRIATAEDGTAFMALAWSAQLDGLLLADSAGRIWLWKPGGPPAVWVVLPTTVVGLYPTDEVLIVLPGGGRVAGYGRLDWSKRTLFVVSPSPQLFGSALLPRQDDVLLASFNDGRVYSIRNSDARVELFAEGFTNPTSIAEDKERCVFVANFGGDSISRILP
jgi:hypothetical protein